MRGRRGIEIGQWNKEMISFLKKRRKGEESEGAERLWRDIEK